MSSSNSNNNQGNTISAVEQAQKQETNTQEQQVSNNDTVGLNKNPITSEELQNRLREVVNDKEKSARFQEQLNIKFRTEMQHAKYFPPDEFKDHPSLQSTDTDLSNNNIQLQPSPRKIVKGETKLTEEQVNNAITTQEQAAQEAANQQEQPSQGLKG